MDVEVCKRCVTDGLVFQGAERVPVPERPVGMHSWRKYAHEVVHFIDAVDCAWIAHYMNAAEENGWGVSEEEEILMRKRQAVFCPRRSHAE